MNVILAEKPSMGGDIASALGIAKREKGYITLQSGDVVTWAIGHIIQQKTPDTYPGYKEWNLENLPFVPDPILMEEDPDKKDQLRVIAGLLKRADCCIIATDPGREGEHIARTILEHVGFRGELKRLWIDDLTPETIKEGFRKLRTASDFDNLAAAAKVRAAADFWMGITATRFFTVLAREVLQEDTRLSAGRVQTPTLRIVYDRERDIENFVPTPFFTLYADFSTGQESYRGQWFKEEPGEGKVYRFDTEQEAKAMLAKIDGQTAEVVSYRSKEVRRQAPLLFDKVALQSAARKLLGFDIHKTTKLLQAVYDKKYCSYPRGSSQHLSENAADQLADNLSKLRKTSQYKELFPETIESLKGNKRFVNNAKAAEHHAIIPTGRDPQQFKEDEKNRLSPDEEKIYKLILQHTLAAFHPEGIDQETEVITRSGGELFASKGVFTLKRGWRDIAAVKDDEDADPDELSSKQRIPDLKDGQAVQLQQSGLHTGQTSKPKRLTDTDLLNLMKYAGRLLKEDDLEDEILQQIKEKGIGTPATRDEIISKLTKDEYIRIEKSAVYLTDKGRHFMELVYDHPLSSIELTGEFEQKLEQVAAGSLQAEVVQEEFKAFTYAILEMKEKLQDQMQRKLQGKPLFDNRVALGNCPICGKAVIEGKKGYGCSGWKEGCTFTIWKSFRKTTIRAKQASDLLAGKEILLKDIPAAKEGKTYELLVKLDGADLSTSFPTIEDKSIGSCPLCKKPVIPGANSYGCIGWKEGCQFRLPKEFRKQKLPERAVKTLLAGNEVLLKDVPKSSGEGVYSIYIFLRDGKLDSRFPEADDLSLGKCPRCQKPIVETQWNYSCSNRKEGCSFKLQKEFLGVKVTAAQIKKLLKRGHTDELVGFKGGKNGSFNTALGYDMEANRFSFVKVAKK
ncbi:type IA DNA topoisomerase [Paenibacillus terreus]|uniref:type IA DNA topoisomerase n=1 Tax=Paenibacillus terreus TaxID=1387834 RepID=UPI0035CD3210